MITEGSGEDPATSVHVEWAVLGCGCRYLPDHDQGGRRVQCGVHQDSEVGYLNAGSIHQDAQRRDSSTVSG